MMPVFLFGGTVIGGLWTGFLVTIPGVTLHYIVIGAIAGAGLSYVFMILVPFMAPLPSTLLEANSDI